jgi:hypothetical protein
MLVVNSKRFSAVCNRNIPIQEIINSILSLWRFNLLTRKPSVIFDEVGIPATDLDMATFLMELTGRKATAVIPDYRTMFAATVRENVKVNPKNRYGTLLGLNANKKTFNFSLRMWDNNVTNSSNGTVGAYRKFSLTDLEGNLYQKFSGIEFDPTAEENEFLKPLYDENSTINFQYFVSPERRTTIYSAPYMLTKLLIERIDDEAKTYFAHMKSLNVNTTSAYEESEAESEIISVGSSKDITVRALEVEVDHSGFIGEYNLGDFDTVEDNYEFYRAARNNLIYKVKPFLTVYTRLAELAYFKYDVGKLPDWIEGQGFNWQPYKKPKARITWDMLSIVDGEKMLSLRKRVHDVNVHVSDKYEEASKMV